MMEILVFHSSIVALMVPVDSPQLPIGFEIAYSLVFSTIYLNFNLDVRFFVFSNRLLLLHLGTLNRNFCRCYCRLHSARFHCCQTWECCSYHLERKPDPVVHLHSSHGSFSDPLDQHLCVSHGNALTTFPSLLR